MNNSIRTQNSFLNKPFSLPKTVVPTSTSNRSILEPLNPLKGELSLDASFLTTKDQQSKPDSANSTKQNQVKQIVDKEITSFPKDLTAVSSSRLQELLKLYEAQSQRSLLLKVHPFYQKELALEVSDRINLLIEELNVRGIEPAEASKPTKAPKSPVELKAERILDRQLFRFPEDLGTTHNSRLGELYANYLQKGFNDLYLNSLPDAEPEKIKSSVFAKLRERVELLALELNKRFDLDLQPFKVEDPLSKMGEDQVEREIKKNTNLMRTLFNSGLQHMIPMYQDKVDRLNLELDLRKYGDVKMDGTRYMSADSYKRKEQDNEPSRRNAELENLTQALPLEQNVSKAEGQADSRDSNLEDEQQNPRKNSLSSTEHSR